MSSISCQKASVSSKGPMSELLLWVTSLLCLWALIEQPTETICKGKRSTERSTLRCYSRWLALLLSFSLSLPALPFLRLLVQPCQFHQPSHFITHRPLSVSQKKYSLLGPLGESRSCSLFTGALVESGYASTTEMVSPQLDSEREELGFTGSTALHLQGKASDNVKQWKSVTDELRKSLGPIPHYFPSSLSSTQNSLTSLSVWNKQWAKRGSFAALSMEMK